MAQFQFIHVITFFGASREETGSSVRESNSYRFDLGDSKSKSKRFHLQNVESNVVLFHLRC